MLQKHVLTIDTTSIQTNACAVRAITLPFVIVAAAGVGGITSPLPQPTTPHCAWCIQSEGAVQCDFTTRAQCMQTASGTDSECIANPHLIVRSPSRNAYGKLTHQRSIPPADSMHRPVVPRRE
jgi:Protein of unknown function (DUF3551)